MSAGGESLGDAYVNVLADTSRLGAGLERAKMITTSALGRVAGVAAGLIGVGLGAQGAFHGMMNAIQKGAALNDLSIQTGVAVKDLVVLQQAFQNAGASAEMVPRSIMQMQKGLANGKMSNVWKEMGLSSKDLAGKDAGQQFEIIGKALGKVQDPAERTALAMKVFGRSGYMLKGLFADPEAFDVARKGLGSMPYIMARSAGAFDTFEDSVNMAKTKMTGFWTGILVGFEPAMAKVAKFLAGFDFAKVGLNFGKFLAEMQLAFAKGQLGDILWLSLQIGAIKSLNTIISTVELIGKSIKDILVTSFSILMEGDFWSGITDIALGSFGAIGAGLIEIFEKPIAYASGLFDKLFDDMFIKIEQAKQGFRFLLSSKEDKQAQIDLEYGTGKYAGMSEADREKEKLRRGIFNPADNKKTTEDYYNARLNTDKPWLTKRGKESAEESGRYLLSGSSKLEDVMSKPMKNLLSSLQENLKNALSGAGMFSTKEQEALLEKIMSPLRTQIDNDLKNPKAGKKKAAAGTMPEEKETGKGTFVSFSEAIKKAQADAMSKDKTSKYLEKTVEQNDQANEKLDAIVQNTKDSGTIFS